MAERLPPVRAVWCPKTGAPCLYILCDERSNPIDPYCRLAALPSQGATDGG